MELADYSMAPRYITHPHLHNGAITHAHARTHTHTHTHTHNTHTHTHTHNTHTTHTHTHTHTQTLPVGMDCVTVHLCAIRGHHGLISLIMDNDFTKTFTLPLMCTLFISCSIPVAQLESDTRWEVQMNRWWNANKAIWAANKEQV